MKEQIRITLQKFKDQLNQADILQKGLIVAQLNMYLEIIFRQVGPLYKSDSLLNPVIGVQCEVENNEVACYFVYGG